MTPVDENNVVKWVTLECGNKQSRPLQMADSHVTLRMNRSEKAELETAADKALLSPMLCLYEKRGFGAIAMASSMFLLPYYILTSRAIRTTRNDNSIPNVRNLQYCGGGLQNMLFALDVVSFLEKFQVARALRRCAVDDS
jgi:hypothetical protein